MGMKHLQEGVTIQMIQAYLRSKFKGRLVGEDELGNRYYEEKDSSLPDRQRRWVLYRDGREASKIPPHWHGWLHYTLDEPPQNHQYCPTTAWQKEPGQNLTGTPQAYRPTGSLLGVSKVKQDYKPWFPGATEFE